MTIEVCYEALGGDYPEVLSRLKKEERIQKFAIKFLTDDSYNTLQQRLDSEDMEEAFRAAHTLKGLCQNLGFTKLYQSCSQVTEYLRVRKVDEARKFMSQVDKDYSQTVEALKAYKAELE